MFVGYSLLGVPLDYLLSATFMTAPAGLLMAKMIVPETHEHELPKEAELAAAGGQEDRPVNIFDAAAKGALDGLRVALGVGALLVAFISLIALLNLIIGEAGGLLGIEDLTFEKMLGWVFAPVAFVIGVPWSEAAEAGNFLGQKLILNEFVAFSDFGPQADQFSERTVAVVTFALCGFANFGSFAILLGALGELAPPPAGSLASLGLRAILGGTLANLLNAAVAGMVISL